MHQLGIICWPQRFPNHTEDNMSFVFYTSEDQKRVTNIGGATRRGSQVGWRVSVSWWSEHAGMLKWLLVEEDTTGVQASWGRKLWGRKRQLLLEGTRKYLEIPRNISWVSREYYYLYSWLNNPEMCVRRAEVITLWVMSKLMTGETKDMVSPPVRGATPT